MKKPNRGPDPFQALLIYVVLLAVFVMAVEALVYQSVLVQLIPPDAPMTFSNPFDGPAQVSPAVRYYVK